MRELRWAQMRFARPDRSSVIYQVIGGGKDVALKVEVAGVPVGYGRRGDGSTVTALDTRWQAYDEQDRHIMDCADRDTCVRAVIAHWMLEPAPNP